MILQNPNMKKLLPVLLFVAVALVGCKETNSTTTTGGDSTKVAAVDSPTVILDSPAVVDVPPVPSDSQAVVATDDNATTSDNGKKINPDPIVTATRLTVSFISIGEGTDYKAKEKFEKFVTDFETRNKVKLVSEKVGWGREGEVDYCYDLATLKPLQRAAFVQETKALVKGNKLVQLKENTPCRKPR